MNKYWILVDSKNHVTRAIEEGVAQACHGKAYPLKRMDINDGIIYYSPKLIYGESEPCQQFTAIPFALEDVAVLPSPLTVLMYYLYTPASRGSAPTHIFKSFGYRRSNR